MSLYLWPDLTKPGFHTHPILRLLCHVIDQKFSHSFVVCSLNNRWKFETDSIYTSAQNYKSSNLYNWICVEAWFCQIEFITVPTSKHYNSQDRSSQKANCPLLSFNRWQSWNLKNIWKRLVLLSRSHLSNSMTVLFR